MWKGTIQFRRGAAVALVALGLLGCCLVVGAHRDALGAWRFAAYLGASAVLAGLAWLYRLQQIGRDESEAVKHLQQTLRSQIEEELIARSAELDRREQALANRLITYQQWLEFPQPINLASADDQVEELSDLAQRDRQMLQLLEKETERVFDAVRANKYAPAGAFDIRLLRDDVDDLIRRVARIYQPDSENPILATSMARVLPAASRACLHFLVALDELPLKVKDRSIGSIYAYIRQAVKAYGVYKAARPYFFYANSAYYLSRFVMGANPMTMGAWWILGQVGKRGAETMATRILNRQALALLNNLIRILGYEVAGIFGGDFRHRDANWIYAAELTDVISRFPLTERRLSSALQELGTIQLRSEYDRIFLYRCLASHRSAEPQRYAAKSVLTAKERLAVAARLEDFIESYLDDAADKTMDRWKADLERRLSLKLKDAATLTPSDVLAQSEDAVRSLASFLLVVKQYDLEEIAPLLRQTKLYGQAGEQQQQAWAAAWADDPPSFFERPNLSVTGSVVPLYLDDLIRLETRTPNRGAQNDEIIVDMGVHLRQDPEGIARKLDQAYCDFLRERSAASVSMKQIPIAATRAILDLLDDDEQLDFLYARISLVRPLSEPDGRRWLMGTPRRCLLLAADPQPRLLWNWRGEVALQRIGGILQSDCQVEGGEWLDRGNSLEQALDEQPVFRVAGARLTRYRDYFLPLLQFSESLTSGPAASAAADSA